MSVALCYASTVALGAEDGPFPGKKHREQCNVAPEALTAEGEAAQTKWS